MTETTLTITIPGLRDLLAETVEAAVTPPNSNAPDRKPSTAQTPDGDLHRIDRDTSFTAQNGQLLERILEPIFA